MSDFQIDRGLPIPEVIKGRPMKYPFADMQVGDSFSVTLKQGRNASTAARVYAHRHPGVQFTSRKDVENFRIWRTA